MTEDLVTYPEGTPFPGTVGRELHDSSPAWPAVPTAPAGAPNIVMVVLDDVGYAQLGCFGSDIDTPAFDRLAANGLRYRSFHTTAMCSPTRACLLTGRNQHTTGMGGIADTATGYPGYHGRIPRSCGFLPEMIVPHGYAAWAVGKWHLAPREESDQAAPRARWPLGRGFERFYGFLGAETNQYYPDLIADNHHIVQRASPEDGYHLTEDLTDRAVELVSDLRNVTPDKPFLTLSADEQRLSARMMEVYAGFLTHTDHHVGRLLDHLEAVGDLDNTIVMVLSDNGASPEGGPHGSYNSTLWFNGIPQTHELAAPYADDLGGPLTHGHYPYGWAHAGNTPFQRWKRECHEGGIADPFIVSWPRVITDHGAIRTQYAHAIDLLPTLLEAVGIDVPDVIGGVPQDPVAGVSLLPTFVEADAPDRRTTQYYELLGCRAIYHDGWKAVAYHAMAGQLYDGVSDPRAPFDQDRWELYDVRADVSECHDLAAERPDKLREMQERWWVEAGRYGALPLHSSRPVHTPRPTHVRPRNRYVYRPGSPVPSTAAVDVRHRAHVIVADITVPEGGSEGVIVAHGGRFGGYSLFVQDGRLHYVYNRNGLQVQTLVADRDLPHGRVRVGISYRPTQPLEGDVELRIGDDAVGSGHIVTVPYTFSLFGDDFCIGYDDASPVSPRYEPPFAFSGTIHTVVVDVTDTSHDDADLAWGAALASQ